MKQILLVARDVAPSFCFERLRPVLKERGFEVKMFIGKGKPFEDIATPLVKTLESALVVLGMSSSSELAEHEIAVGRAARQAKVPYGFYGDVPRCWMRARQEGGWFNDLAQDAAFYFGITQEDAEEAREVFPKARLIGTGNPLREDMAFPRFTREQVRAKLGILPEEKLILAPGNKFAAGNMASWALLIDALYYFLAAKKDWPCQLVLAIHPGDMTPTGLYQELVSFSPVPARILDRNILTTSDVVAGADIVVEFSSSIGIGAAHQRIPVITLGLEILFHELAREGGSVPEIVDCQASKVVGADYEDLADAIESLLNPESQDRKIMRENQEYWYPVPEERGTALRKMAEAIELIVNG